MKVFLTGGTGFVGSHVAEILTKAGHEVTALVRATSKTAHLESLGATLQEGALGKAEGFSEALSGVDAVVHVAGLVAARSPEVMREVNAGGTRDLVEVTARVCRRGIPFVYVSSVAAQGPSKGREPRPLTEAPSPVSHYGQTKLEGEEAVLSCGEALQVMILRPPPVYGPRDTDMFQVFQMARLGLGPVLGGGERWLSVIHAEDLARAVAACLENPGAAKIYPIDDGGRYTWEDLGRTIGEAMGKSVRTLRLPRGLFRGAAALSEAWGTLRGSPPTFDRDKYLEMVQPSWVCGNSELCGDTGWAPEYDLLSGARQTAAWYRENGWL